MLIKATAFPGAQENWTVILAASKEVYFAAYLGIKRTMFIIIIIIINCEERKLELRICEFERENLDLIAERVARTNWASDVAIFAACHVQVRMEECSA